MGYSCNIFPHNRNKMQYNSIDNLIKVLRHNPSVTLRKYEYLVESCVGFFFFCHVQHRLTLRNIRFIRNCFLNTCRGPQCTLLTPLLKPVSFLFCPVRLLFFTRLHHSWRNIFLPRFHSRVGMPAYSAII